MRHKAFTKVEIAAVLVILIILAAVLFPVFFRARENGGKRNACPSNLKQIVLGTKQYIQDYDEKYPLIATNQGGWMEVLQPYLKSTQLFQCPSESSGAVQGCTDYFYNSRLSGEERNNVEDVSRTIMNGDGVGNAKSDAHTRQLPPDWSSSSNSPARRHLDGAHYSFGDGHVKWLRAEDATTLPAKSGKPTFSTQ